ncbi:hypothetical protein SUGI_0922540 [Cryptomeria japonica]|nr:hypothetical protein SUGI_0922540 [Cryptomeria japonica]
MEVKLRDDAGLAAFEMDDMPDGSGSCIAIEDNKASNEEEDCNEQLEEGVIDVSGKEWIFPLLEEVEAEKAERVRGLYVYNNVFGVIPESVRRLKRLKTLKLFSNEVKLLPWEVGDLVELEQLHVKVCESSGLGSLPPFRNLKALKELELCKMPPRPSAFSLSTEISYLKSLTRLSVCHFAISFLPSEIGSLKKLEELDLSFNKLKTLPNNIADLIALKSLKVASNKLVELPLGISSLSSLTTVDVSNNRLTSLQSLELYSMRALRKLNLQHNKLRDTCQIPTWISCNLEGNVALGKDIAECDPISSSSEEEVSDSNICKENLSHSFEGQSETSLPSSSYELVPSIRCSQPSRRKTGWKRRYTRQEKARQERLNNSRKFRAEDYQERDNGGIVMESLSVSMPLSNCAPYLPQQILEAPISETELTSLLQDVSRIDKDSVDRECSNGRKIDSISSVQKTEVKVSPENSSDAENLCCTSSVVTASSITISNNRSKVELSKTPLHVPKEAGQLDSYSESNNDACTKTGRRHGVCIKNPKPSKRIRSVQEFYRVSQKYSNESFCGVNDILPDGFYDAGRDRPFKPLRNFEKENVCLGTREVILVDRERDEELDAIVLSAQQVISGWKRFGEGSDEYKSRINDYQRASLLVLFVSNCFGGSDKSMNISTMRRAVAGANVEMPFVCSCSLDSNSNLIRLPDQAFRNDTVPRIEFLCEQSVRTIKEQRNSNVVPIGAIQYGVCRHRAILMKYLCDRADPPIPCELVRGYMDYMPHAWNAIIINKDGKWVRLIVDACRPFDIRDEEDPEYFCRYIPLNRFLFPIPNDKDSLVSRNSGVWPCLHEEIARGASGCAVRRCTIGQLTAAAKVRCLEVSRASKEQQNNFEYSCLGEVRILGALKNHPCIIELYGHQLSSSWVSLSDGMGESQVVQSLIAMEYVKGGSLEVLLGKLAQEGKKCTPSKLAIFIARDVACALSELHSKKIIHRDVKSKNVLIDLEVKRADESPLVKLCDFDMAVPLHSSSHTCCLAHHGVPPAEFCVGTPRWMAPEMVQAMHRPQRYGVEVDIWSFGCLIFELLTLQIPYAGLSDVEIHHRLQMEQRPQCTSELEKYLFDSKDKVPDRIKNIFPEENAEVINLLADLFYSCTESDPALRPTAKQAYEILSAVAGKQA